MTKTYLEWDWPPEPRRRRRQPLPLEGEILGPKLPEPSPRIRVEVVHRAYQQPRQRQGIPPWAIAILAIGMLCWISPFGLVVGLVMGGILIASHPTIAIAVVAWIAIVTAAALYTTRWRGRAF